MLGRRRETTADVQEASTVAPDRTCRIACNGPDADSDPCDESPAGGDDRPWRIRSDPTSHRLSYAGGYQREQSLDTVRRAPSRPRSPPTAARATGHRSPSASRHAEEIEALRELHARLVATPVEDVVVNHALGIWQLALVHLGVVTPPDDRRRRAAPDLAPAGLAIDAMAALVDGLGDRLGEDEEMLRDALAPGPDALRRDRRRQRREPTDRSARPARRASDLAVDAVRRLRAQLDRAASQRPRWPGRPRTRTSVPTAIVRVPSAITVQWNG